MPLDIRGRTFSKKSLNCSVHKTSIIKTCSFTVCWKHASFICSSNIMVAPTNFILQFWVQATSPSSLKGNSSWRIAILTCERDWACIANAYKTELPGNVPSVGGALGAVYLCKEGDYIKWAAEFNSTVVFAFYVCRHIDFKILPKIKNSATIGVVSQSCKRWHASWQKENTNEPMCQKILILKCWYDRNTF